MKKAKSIDNLFKKINYVKSKFKLKINLILFVFSLLIFSSGLNAQECYTTDVASIDSSALDKMTFRNYLSYLPNDNSDIIVIKVNLHVMLKSSEDPQNFINIPEHITYLKNLVGEIGDDTYGLSAYFKHF